MTVRELIEKLESLADEYGDDIPVCTFDLDRHTSDITEVEFYQGYNLNHHIYLGAD